MRKPLTPEGRAARVLAVGLALLLWQAAALLINNDLLLVTPLRVLARLAALAGSGGFWRALGRSFAHIAGGFLAALALGAALGALSYRRPWAGVLLRPYMTAVKTVPVASFIILALVWLPSGALSFFIAFLMVLPVIYANVLTGLRSADKELLEMAAIFAVPWKRRWRAILLPALQPYVLAACSVALGVCWKAGVAAEVIGVVRESIGGQLYEAKIYLEIADLFAWTAVIVAVSAVFERLFLALLRALFKKGAAL